MAFDTWVNIIFPSEKTTADGRRATDPDPGMSNSTRYYMEGGILRSHALAAQAAFDQALVLAQAGEGVKVVSEVTWRRVASQASEPARRAKVAAYSARKREADAEQKRQRAEEREAKKAEKAEAESNGHLPAGVDDEDLRDAAVEELALVRAREDTDMDDETAGEDGG